MEVSKHFKVLWCMFETFCFGGIHYGWTSLVYVLKREGFFAEECAHYNDTDEIQSYIQCDEQDAQLALLYSLSNGLAVIPIFLCGNSLSRFGVQKTRLVWTCIFMAGCMMMIVSSPDMPWFACVGLGFIAGGGTIFQLTGIQLSRLYQTGSFLVIMLMSGCYDSSSAMMLFVKFAYEAGVSRKVSFGVILGLCITAIIGTFVNFNEPTQTTRKESNVDDTSIDKESTVDDTSIDKESTVDDTSIDKESTSIDKESTVDDTSIDKESTVDDTSIDKESAVDGTSIDKEITVDDKGECEDEITVRTIYRSHLCSRTFISHVVWFTLLAVHFAFIIAASNINITTAADNEADQESLLTNFLSLALFTGIVPAICTGLCLELFKKKQTGSVFIRNLKTSTAGLFTTNTLSAVLSVLFILQSVYAMYAAFIVLPIFRAILFSVVFSFIARTFPEKAFGSLSAVIEFQSCFSLFIQRALIEWLQSYEEGAMHIEITFLVISVVAMFHPIALIFRIRSLVKQENTQYGSESADKIYSIVTDAKACTSPNGAIISEEPQATIENS